MSTSRHQKLARRKHRIEQRLQPRTWPAEPTPMYTASNDDLRCPFRHAHGLHEAALATFYRIFGDVRPSSEVMQLLSA